MNEKAGWSFFSFDRSTDAIFYHFTVSYQNNSPPSFSQLAKTMSKVAVILLLVLEQIGDRCPFVDSYEKNNIDPKNHCIVTIAKNAKSLLGHHHQLTTLSASASASSSSIISSLQHINELHHRRQTHLSPPSSLFLISLLHLGMNFEVSRNRGPIR